MKIEKKYISFDPKEGYPSSYYYECQKCKSSIVGCPLNYVSCDCYNVRIDADSGRMIVNDDNMIKAFECDIETANKLFYSSGARGLTSIKEGENLETGNNIYYGCDVCGIILSSIPSKDTSCLCQNIQIFQDGKKIEIVNFKKIYFFRHP